MVDASTSRTNAVTVGGAANIYINLQGRKPTGIVPLEQYEALQKQIENVFKAINDPITNERVFEIILKTPRGEFILQEKSRFDAADTAKSRGRERDFHVFGEDTGDVLVVTIPGYNLDFNAGTGGAIGNLFQPSTFFGQHGYDPRLPEMRRSFMPLDQTSSGKRSRPSKISTLRRPLPTCWVSVRPSRRKEQRFTSAIMTNLDLT